ncbi:MAG: hypothetical protein GX139_04220 [Armatimonadetes bacterium]|nr:hypothetical protein [Armatimonadota bacterium]
MANTVAGPAIAGKTCPFCQTPIKPNEPVHICDQCNIPHHQDCWRENGGCTTFGCRGANAARPIIPQRAYDDHSQPVQQQPYFQPNQQPGYGNQYQQHYQYAPDVPPEIMGKLNWGAFLLPFFWAIAHNVWIGLLILVPYVGWVMHFVLLFKGNEWAWRNRRFQSVQHFNEVQNAWVIAGLILFFGSIVFVFILMSLAYA